jgi:hypothetical protein
MNSRIGKIARLPKPIREQINLRLENGETAAALVKWLNQLPEVQKLLTEQFAGQPIRPQNLSQWRNGGYLDWLRHQQLREQTRWTTEQSEDLHSDTDANTISIAENVALIMSAELALHVQALLGIKNPKQRFRQFCLLSRELSRMRRDDQRACRTILRREQWQATRPPAQPETVEEPETQTLELETLAQPETQNPNPETLVQPETLNSKPETAPQPETIDPPETIDQPEADTRHSPLDTYDVPNAPWPSTINYQPSTTPTPVIPQNPTKSHYNKLPLPIRGRRFVCVEG